MSSSAVNRKPKKRRVVTRCRLTAHGSRLTAHGSRLTAHGSRLTAHGSRLVIRCLHTRRRRVTKRPALQYRFFAAVFFYELPLVSPRLIICRFGIDDAAKACFAFAQH